MEAQALPDPETQARVARNDVIFRDANEGIVGAAAGTDLAESGVPFICECADRSCRELVLVPLREYERIRSNPRWFLNAAGHEANALGAAAAIERHGAYVIVEKLDLAGEIAEAEDPRARRAEEAG